MGPKNRQSLTLFGDSDEICLIVTKDGKILRPDKDGEYVCINEINNIQLPDSITMKQLLDVGDIFNKPGGLYFETTKKLLEKYRFFAMSKGKKLEIQEGFRDDMELAENESGEPVKLTVYENDDITEWMHFLATRDSAYPKRLARFVNSSDNVVLSYSIEKIVRSGVEMLLHSPSKQYQEYGDLLYARYIHPDYGDENIDFFISISAKKKTAYFATLNKSIACLSSYFFGAFPGDQSLLVAEFDEDLVQVKIKE